MSTPSNSVGVDLRAVDDRIALVDQMLMDRMLFVPRMHGERVHLKLLGALRMLRHPHGVEIRR